MPPPPQPPDAERVQTDQSLRAEREVTDEVLGDKQESVDDLADAEVERARVRADQVLAAARHKSDHGPGRAAPSAPMPHALESERAHEDRVLREERAEADEVLSAERAQHTALLSTERKETDEDLSRERRRADDAVAVRDEFLGIVSHDLRNMLSSILLSATSIEETAGGEHGAQITQHAQRIRRSGARMDRLVGDLVDVASIEAGALAVTRERADAAIVVAEAIETVQAQATASGVSLRSDVPAPLVATFDPARILQVLGNLLSNALKFTPSGGSITVRAQRTAEGLLVSVTDTGTGIPADKLEVVFQRFRQLDGSDRRGLGLGLYISQCIVEGHGGRIWAESELGAGSTLSFTLPHRPVTFARATVSVS